MTSIDNKIPPVKVIEKGANAIRSYWNNKNLKKRNTDRYGDIKNWLMK